MSFFPECKAATQKEGEPFKQCKGVLVPVIIDGDLFWRCSECSRKA